MERAVALEFGVAATADGVPFSGRTDRAIAGDLFALHGVADSIANWERFRAAYLQELPGCLASHQGVVLPGVGAFLDSLRKRPRVAVGLLTGNVREGARLKLDHFGLWNHFAFGGFGDEHYDRDDVAREALAVVRRHVVEEPEQVWVIGDTPLDIRCARCIGARVVAVATGWHSAAELEGESPDLLVADLSDPRPVLTHWGWEPLCA